MSHPDPTKDYVDPDDCQHPKFNDNHRCEVCGVPCEHWYWEDGFCVDCGFFRAEDPPYDTREEWEGIR